MTELVIAVAAGSAVLAVADVPFVVHVVRTSVGGLRQAVAKGSLMDPRAGRTDDSGHLRCGGDDLMHGRLGCDSRTLLVWNQG